MHTRTTLIVSFGGVLLLTLWLGGLVIFHKMQDLGNNPQQLYVLEQHLRSIQEQLHAIQLKMSAVLQSKANKTTEEQMQSINVYERKIYQYFEQISAQFPQQKQPMQTIYHDLIQWQKTRNNIFYLLDSQQEQQAFEQHLEVEQLNIQQLQQDIQKLNRHLIRNSYEQLRNQLKQKQFTLYGMFLILLLSLCIGLVVMWLVIKKHDKTLGIINRYLDLIDKNILIATMDNSGQFSDVSHALCQFLAYERHDILQQNIPFIVNQTSDAPLCQQIWQHIQTGQPWQGEIKRLNNRQQAQWIDLTIHPVFDLKQKIIGYSHILHDISDKKRIEAMSVTDKLTGLYNRHHYDKIIDKEINIAKRGQTYLTLAILDIDFFKKYNDNYGHPAGDGVLEQVANVLRHSLQRPNDYAFRLGGEEFGLLFANLNRDQSFALLDNIRNKIVGLHIRHQYSAINPFVTVSIGGKAVVGDKILDKEQLYIQTDKILYQAKERRNTVMVE
jgi:diguanylate cyclase (GGDEF)-like protein/PAS domain S-box-containing protein